MSETSSAAPERPPHTGLVLSDAGAVDAARVAVSVVHESVKLGIYVLNSEGLVLSADDPLARLFAEGSVPRVGQSFWESNPSLHASDVGRAVRRALDGPGPTVVHAPVEGVDRWVEISAVRSGENVAVWCRDVTADQRISEQLADHTRRLRRKAALLDVATEAIFIREMDDTLSYWNLGAANLYGRPAPSALGSSARTMLQTETDEYDAATRLLLRDGKWSGELEQTSRDGREWTADCRWQLSRDEQGNPSFVLCVMTDITEMKRERNALFRAQRMDSLGGLAGGMAHDLNNVFTPILLSTQLLSAEESDPTKRSLLESIETSAERGAGMIRQVLTFARGEESRRRLLDIEALLEQLVTFCAEVLPKTIIVSTHVPHHLPPVLGDSTQLLQILMNLVTNARDAMPNGGRLSITAHSTPTKDTAGEEQPAVAIMVQDSGTGMSEGTVAKIFDPFFTTKTLGQGTGLGLSTSVAIARAHGGELRVRSRLGHGSEFHLHLPATTISTPARHDDANVSSPAIGRGRGERVLVVDDESTIRTIVQHTLEANGYETVAAEDGVEAIMLLEAPDLPIDLVLTDTMMPVIDGVAVAAYLFQHHPHVALIAASGVETTEESVRAAHLGVTHFLAKPFSTDDLLRAARDALDSRASEPSPAE